MERQSGKSKDVDSNPSSTMSTVSKKLTRYSIRKKDLFGEKESIAVWYVEPSQFGDKEGGSSLSWGKRKVGGGVVMTVESL